MPQPVRPAEQPDVPAITDCYLRSWKAVYSADLDPDMLAIEAEKRRSFNWQGAIEDEDVGVFVAVDEQTVVGVLQANLTLPPPRDLPEITMLYTDPCTWGTGTATALLDTGVDWIKRNGHSVARLRIVEAHQRARRFYEREGWVRDDALPAASNDFFRLIYYRRDLDRAADGERGSG